MRPVPIRLQLTLWYCAMFTAAAMLLSISSWWTLRQSLNATEYHELQERVDDVQLLLKQSPGEAPAEMEQRLTAIYQVKDDGKYLQVMDQDGQWIYRSKRMLDAGLAAPLLLPAGLPRDGVISDIRWDVGPGTGRGMRDVRFLQYPILVNGRAYTVQTGISMNRSMLLLSNFAMHLFLLTPAVLIAAAVGGHFMSRKALAPVAAIATEARRINDRNLGVRLPVSSTHDELAHLSETLNQMLERIDLGVKSIREFTANAAHELRTPLALIRTEVEVALSFPRSGAEYREACEQVQLETVRLGGLIDSLLMLARVDSGTEALRIQAIDLNDLLLQTATKWKTAMQHALLDFIVEVPLRGMTVQGDPQSLQRLFTILLDNASRYTPAGGRVVLSANESGDRVRIAIRDTGIGIAAEHLPHIFERFYRGDRAHDTKANGSGLGLALAQWIAENHGTALMVESEIALGTCFSFSLPIASPEGLRRVNETVGRPMIEQL